MYTIERKRVEWRRPLSPFFHLYTVFDSGAMNIFFNFWLDHRIWDWLFLRWCLLCSFRFSIYGQFKFYAYMYQHCLHYWNKYVVSSCMHIYIYISQDSIHYYCNKYTVSGCMHIYISLKIAFIIIVTNTLYVFSFNPHTCWFVRCNWHSCVLCLATPLPGTLFIPLFRDSCRLVGQADLLHHTQSGWFITSHTIRLILLHHTQSGWFFFLHHTQ